MKGKRTRYTLPMAAIMLLAMLCSTAMATVRVVNQTSGPYFTISAAITAAAAGDTISITDSGIYREAVTVNKNSLIVQGAEGERPCISGELLPGTSAVVTVTGTGVSINNIGIYVGGAGYGINVANATTTISDCSFDVHIAGRSGNTFAILVSTTNQVNVTNCNFNGQDNVAAGGILMNLSSARLAVNQCDFWGIGTVGGVIGLGVTTSGTISIQNSCFANGRYAGGIYGINTWGNNGITITETDNTFYDIDVPMSGHANGGVLSTSSAAVSGNGTPQDSPVAISMAHIDNLLNYNGVPVVPDPTLQPFQGPVYIGDYLFKTVRWFDQRRYYYEWDHTLGAWNGQNANSYMSYVGARHWENYETTWGWDHVYNPAIWKSLKTMLAETHSTMPNMLCGGMLMECIGKPSIEATPIPNELWCWMVRWTRAIPMRPLQVGVLDGRRITAHFFDYDLMLGEGVNEWGPDLSIPNLNKQEALMYYLYLAKQMIDAGMNEITLGQPQATFGQNHGWDNYGGANFQMVTKFAKNYGLYRAPYIDGKRFVMIGANTSINWLKNYCNFVDYVISPAGADSVGCGLAWYSPSDQYGLIPPASVGLTGKPIALQFDNFSSPNDHISYVAHASYANRIASVRDWTHYVHGNFSGYFVFQPGWIPITATGSQNFTGCTPPQAGGSFNTFFLPWNVYTGGFQNLTRDLLNGL